MSDRVRTQKAAFTGGFLRLCESAPAAGSVRLPDYFGQLRICQEHLALVATCTHAGPPTCVPSAHSKLGASGAGPVQLSHGWGSLQAPACATLTLAPAALQALL